MSVELYYTELVGGNEEAEEVVYFVDVLSEKLPVSEGGISWITLADCSNCCRLELCWSSGVPDREALRKLAADLANNVTYCRARTVYSALLRTVEESGLTFRAMAGDAS